MTKHTFTLTIEGQRINVTYTPEAFVIADYGHFVFASPTDPPRRTPVSETGFRSHFAPMWEIREAGSPEIYAEALIHARLKLDRKTQAEQSDAQPSLF